MQNDVYIGNATSWTIPIYSQTEIFNSDRLQVLYFSEKTLFIEHILEI